MSEDQKKPGDGSLQDKSKKASGCQVPEGARVNDEEASGVEYLVLPVNPAKMTDDELSKVSGGTNQGECVTGPYWVSYCSSNCIFDVPGGCQTGPYWVTQCSSNCRWTH